MTGDSRPIYAGVFLTSLCVLTLELALTRLFSATMYYHFAFLAISVALFGAGASGVLVFLGERKFERYGNATLLTWCTLFFSVGVVIALLGVLSNPLAVSATPDADVWSLTRIYLATSVPFFFAGGAITLAISRYAHDIGRIYLADLAGAAVGCLLLIPLLNSMGGVNAVLTIAILAALAATLFSRAASRLMQILAATSVILSAALLIGNQRYEWLAVRWAKGVPTSDVLFSKWNSFSHVTVSGDPQSDHLNILIDADAGTAIARGAGKYRAVPNPPITIEGLVHLLKRNADVLIIGPGGGIDVFTARLYGQKQITAVEVNPIIAHDVMQSEPFVTYSANLYGQPDVRLVVDEGRSFIRSSTAQYDVIQATMVDTWAATAAGAFALSENNLYTVEAFKDYITHLTPDGMLSMTRWYLEPPDQLLRLVTISRQALEELGISDPASHFVIIRAGGDTDRVAATFLFKKSPFTERELGLLDQVARLTGFVILYTPRTQQESLFARLLRAENPEEVWEKFPLNVEPTRDNNPFFFNTLRLSQIGSTISASEEWRKTNLGTYVLFALLAISAVLVVLFILGPLAIARGRELSRQRGSYAFIAYFAALGGAFIIIEVALIQKFILFLGHPMYALTVVLFSILCFSSIGSYLTRTFAEERLTAILQRVLVVIAALVFVYILVLPPIFYGLVHLDQWVRIVIAVLLVAPLSLVMGMPMPLGIRIASTRNAALIPWGWGVNGAMSVLGSVSSLVIAILTGFSQVLGVGAAIYLLAIFAVRRFEHAPRTDAW